jgi:hypothetical protein
MGIKGISVLLTAGLIVAIPAISPASTAKLGAKCSKVNTTSGSLICKKVGSKLIWQKKAITKPSPTPTATASPTPTPTPTPTSTPTVSPTPTPTPEPTGPSAPITFDNLDLKWTASIARQNLAAEFAKLTQPKSTAIFHIGPNVREDLVIEEKRLLAIAERMFSGYFNPAKYDIVMYSEKDGAWADQKLGTLVNYPPTISKDIASNPRECNSAGAMIHKDGGPVYQMCIDTGGRKINDKQTSIHEYFHLVQFKHSLFDMACWMVEGSATYFGVALGVDGTDPTGQSTTTFLNQLVGQYNPGGPRNAGSANKLREKLSTDSGLLEVLRALEVKPEQAVDCPSLGAYSVGAVITEALIGVKGFKTYMDFVATFPAKNDWKLEFKKSYGLTPDEFYLKLAPYLRARLSG